METLALIESLDRDGLPRQLLRVTAWPVSVGRAVDNDLVLDDPHVAARHLVLEERADGVHLVPGPSVNGVHLRRSTIVLGESAPLPGNGCFVVGATTLRVRLATDVLAPEVPLAGAHVGGRRRALELLALVLAAAAWEGFSEWLSSAPGQPGTEAAGLYMAAPVGLGLWCGLWALGSKLFQRQFAFWPHLRVALFWPLLAMLTEAVAGQFAFALSMPWITRAAHVVAFCAIALLLWNHLAIVLPAKRRSFGWIVAGLALAGGGLDMAERAHHQQPLVGSLYLGTISLPSLRLAHAESPDAFVKSAQPLEKSLTRWAKAGGDDDDDEPAADDDGD
ncbi:MAG TPA: FHA domain-containing protein [Burkholderiaceae bacterium]